MNFEFTIARRIHFQPNREGGRNNQTKPAVRIATIGIALGLAVMLVAVAVVTGFKEQVSGKVIGFGSHIQITSLTNNTTYETEAVSFSDTLLSAIRGTEGIRYAGLFATKPGILKCDRDFHGIVLKGVSPDYDFTFFANNLIAGEIPHYSPDSAASKEVLLSRKIADLMQLNVGDTFLAYFIQESVRVRKFTVAGLYDTGLVDFDNLFIISDLRHVQSLNDWASDEGSGLEILVDDYNRLSERTEAVFQLATNRFDRHKRAYYTRSIRDLQPQIFSWLSLLDMNVVVILILMMAVSGFNMISELLILILDKTSLIGSLKSFGAHDWSIRRIFLYQAGFLIGKGLLWGNAIGIALCMIQKYLHVIPLDPTVYYVDTVPVHLTLGWVLALNIGTALLAILVLMLPSHVIAKISPAKSIRFE